VEEKFITPDKERAGTKKENFDEGNLVIGNRENDFGRNKIHSRVRGGARSPSYKLKG